MSSGECHPFPREEPTTDDRAAYRDAFVACRKHRLDLNLLIDLDPAQFMSSLESFVDQVPEVDYLNLFVSSLTCVDLSISF